MIWVILYVLVGVGMAITLGRAIESNGTGNKANDFVVDVCINLFIILFWPIFVLLFIRSCITYSRKKNERRDHK